MHTLVMFLVSFLGLSRSGPWRYLSSRRLHHDISMSISCFHVAQLLSQGTSEIKSWTCRFDRRTKARFFCCWRAHLLHLQLCEDKIAQFLERKSRKYLSMAFHGFVHALESSREVESRLSEVFRKGTLRYALTTWCAWVEGEQEARALQLRAAKRLRNLHLAQVLSLSGVEDRMLPVHK